MVGAAFLAIVTDSDGGVHGSDGSVHASGTAEMVHGVSANSSDAITQQVDGVRRHEGYRRASVTPGSRGGTRSRELIPQGVDLLQRRSRRLGVDG